MAEKKPVEFKVLRKNKYGHRFILEPKERIKFREKCKYYKLGLCEKNYTSTFWFDKTGMLRSGFVYGCIENTYCPRITAWDKRHGLEKPYIMVENKFPNLKPTSFTWHPSIESPGKKRVLIAFRVKGHEDEYYDFSVIQFCSSGVIPANCAFKTADGIKKLPVAWAYYDDIIKGIEPWMFSGAEFEAWAWWPDKEENNTPK